ncbi:unnamed protein product [Caenorhabditis auriculariae]|uniref:Sm domain-containing protein n=1 Tax=Caenorhabditis auriculariae TaxID=2777116 RepID=A0A8S1GUS1_9PELO|nr:unnamed protein product [Caenorhabditis auriculariae]
MDKTERERIQKGLVSFVKGIVGRKVCIELRNNNYVYGTLEDCDSYLNMRIRDADVIRATDSESAAEFFVAGRHVRFVHLEHYADVKSAINRTINGFLRDAKKIDRNQSNANRQSHQ